MTGPARVPGVLVPRLLYLFGVPALTLPLGASPAVAAVVFGACLLGLGLERRALRGMTDTITENSALESNTAEASEAATPTNPAEEVASKASLEIEGPLPRILEETLDIADLGLTITDFEGRVAYINPMEARWQGSSPDQLRGRVAPWVPISEIPAGLRSGAIPFWEHEVSAQQSTEPQGGEPLLLQVRCQAVRGGASLPRLLVTLRRNISHRRTLEETFERHRRILQAVELAAERLLADPSWETSLSEVLGALAEATETQRAHFLTDLDSLDLPSLRETTPVETGFSGEAPHHWLFQPRLGPLETGTLRSLPRGLRRALGSPLEGSYALLPLVDLGCLCLESTEEDRTWAPQEMDALRAAARMLGSALLRQRAEHTLMHREERFRTLLDTVSDPIAGFNGEDRFCYINSAFSNLFGYHLGALARRRLRDLVHERDRERLAHRLAALSATEGIPAAEGTPADAAQHPVLTFHTADGREIPLECRLEQTPPEAGETRYRGIFYDRTADQTAHRIQRQFVSLVHHELKTPLTSIVGAVRLLDSNFEQDKDRRLLEILGRNTVQLERLIDKLLDLQRLSLGQMPYQLEDIELQPLLDEVILACKTKAQNGSHRLRADHARSLLIHADREKLLDILDELLTTACTFAWEGTDIRLHLEDRGQEVLLRVRQEGPGLPSGVLDDLFLGVPQEEADTMHPGQRIGIGLTLARGLLEGMSGRLVVESQLGEGTQVTLHLPKATFANRTISEHSQLETSHET